METIAASRIGSVLPRPLKFVTGNAKKLEELCSISASQARSAGVTRGITSYIERESSFGCYPDEWACPGIHVFNKLQKSSRPLMSPFLQYLLVPSLETYVVPPNIMEQSFSFPISKKGYRSVQLKDPFVSRGIEGSLFVPKGQFL